MLLSASPVLAQDSINNSLIISDDFTMLLMMSTGIISAKITSFRLSMIIKLAFQDERYRSQLLEPTFLSLTAVMVMLIGNIISGQWNLALSLILGANIGIFLAGLVVIRLFNSSSDN